jgi:hypothetical protein
VSAGERGREEALGGDGKCNGTLRAWSGEI